MIKGLKSNVVTESGNSQDPSVQVLLYGHGKDCVRREEDSGPQTSVQTVKDP